MAGPRKSYSKPATIRRSSKAQDASAPISVGVWPTALVVLSASTMKLITILSGTLASGSALSAPFVPSHWT